MLGKRVTLIFYVQHDVTLRSIYLSVVLQMMVVHANYMLYKEHQE
jgi:hypothetical protein